MLNKILDWIKRSWGVFAGLAILIGALAAAAQLVDFFEDRLPTPTPSPTIAFTSTPLPTATLTPTPTPTPTVGPFVFLILPAQIKAGEDIKVSVQAWQGATCFLAYYTPDGGMSSARGLGPVIADSLGRCTWEWHISANTSLGNGKLVVSIKDIQETHEIEILAGD
ncbi:MAG: hypothetical protein C4583_18720 [Anaerolineaceae bacterium]|nr:MAG: hypothetical protein C4583_18720 [Anaerolineaceae bacterium]